MRLRLRLGLRSRLRRWLNIPRVGASTPGVTRSLLLSLFLVLLIKHEVAFIEICPAADPKGSRAWTVPIFPILIFIHATFFASILYIIFRSILLRVEHLFVLVLVFGFWSVFRF